MDSSRALPRIRCTELLSESAAATRATRSAKNCESHASRENPELPRVPRLNPRWPARRLREAQRLRERWWIG